VFYNQDASLHCNHPVCAPCHAYMQPSSPKPTQTHPNPPKPTHPPTQVFTTEFLESRHPVTNEKLREVYRRVWTQRFDELWALDAAPSHLSVGGRPFAFMGLGYGVGVSWGIRLQSIARHSSHCRSTTGSCSMLHHRSRSRHNQVLTNQWLADDKVDELKRSGAPILVQVSEYDRLVPPHLQLRLASELHARVVSFPIGHMGLLAFGHK